MSSCRAIGLIGVAGRIAAIQPREVTAMNRLDWKLSWCGAGVAVLLLLAFAQPAVAADPKSVDIAALVLELQKGHRDSGSMTVVGWFPTQYWEISRARNTRLTDKEKKDLVEALRPYTIIGIVCGEVDVTGRLAFRSEAEIRGRTQLMDDKGNTYNPLGEDDIQTAAKTAITGTKSTMAGMAGQLGNNMRFLVFPATDSTGRQIADPESKGVLVVKFDKQEFRWKLPLGSLLPAKSCTKCKEKCSGAWDFCPWCGTKLSSAS
jgi:hypothetical protein